MTTWARACRSDDRYRCPAGVGADGGALWPANAPAGERHGRGFADHGYGKLGGWELGYSSNIDIGVLA
ncbi:hypothetical protein ACNKHQ_17690 [Shigella flexneri]